MKMLSGVLPAAAVVLFAAGCAQQPPAEEAPAEAASMTATASAELMAKSGSNVSGMAMFTAEGGMVKMVLSLEGVPPGSHAVHLHEIGDCSAADGTSAGGHWNPTGDDHGMWAIDPYHRGDIGNVEVGEGGSGSMVLTTDVWTIGGDAGSDIVGRAIIVHAGEDDFVTQPTGNAGGRIACGVIEAPGSVSGDG